MGQPSFDLVVKMTEERLEGGDGWFAWGHEEANGFKENISLSREPVITVDTDARWGRI